MSRMLRSALIATASLTVFCCPAALAQAEAPAAPQGWDADYEPPRMPDGTPSFEGVWSKGSLTVLERSQQFKTQAIPPAMAVAIEQGRARAMEASNRPSDPDAGAPTAGGDDQLPVDSCEHLGDECGQSDQL